MYLDADMLCTPDHERYLAATEAQRVIDDSLRKTGAEL